MSVVKSIAVGLSLIVSVCALSQEMDVNSNVLSGRLNLEGDSIGEWLKYSHSGDTLMVLNFNDRGLRHGSFIIQDSIKVHTRELPSGRIRTNELMEWRETTYKGSYQNGKLDGEQLVLDDSSKVVSTSYFSNGVLQGIAKEYHSDGQLYSIKNYVNGEKHGEFVIFHKATKEKYSVSIYDHGTLIRSENYRYRISPESGEYILASKYQYSEPDHTQDGEWLEYHLNGQLKYVHFYENGLANGEWKGWHENGQLSYLMVYLDNDVFFFEEYDEQGNVK